MKKLLMICGLLFGVITMTNAQDGGRKMSPEDRAKRNTEKLAEKLKLSEDQKAKVLTIYTAQASQMTTHMKEASADQKAKRMEMKSAAEANDAKINSLLTEDQKKAYIAMKEERKAAMQKRGGNKKHHEHKKM
ncbi:protein CpxP [Pedobacter sp. CG_S7]|uniref:hypothetical protein n=1 Tax=Pedobacter sp. CG_S7 TaxID=3143930 RepID=UPI003393C1B4